MSNTRESKLFLSFLKKNWFLLFFPSFFLGGLGFLYQELKPDIYHKQAVLELKYKLPDQLRDSDEDIENKSLFADEIVSVTREEVIRGEMGVESEIKIYKIGPLLIKIDVLDKNKQSLNPSLERVLAHMKSKYVLEERGGWIEDVEKPNRGLGFLTGAFFGGLAGLLFSLFKLYFQKY